MAATYLDEILEYHRARARGDTREWRARVGEVHYAGPSLLEALADRINPHVKVIAEVKRRSPSKGWLREELDAPALVAQYVAGGASAVSVLTDREYFAGSADDLRAVAATTSVPVLRKDFTVSANDVLDAASLGASGVLLIVAALSDEELTSYIALAHDCGMDALVEVHDRDETKRALDSGARLVGVNQRNLRTFEIVRTSAHEVIEVVPSAVVSVCESGLATVDDVACVAELGFDAVLVGETFVVSSNVVDAVRSFSSVPLTAHG